MNNGHSSRGESSPFIQWMQTIGKGVAASVPVLGGLFGVVRFVRNNTSLTLTVAAGVIFLVVCTFLVYILFSKKTIGEDVEGAEQTVSRFEPHWRVGAGIALFAIIFVPTGYLGYTAYEDSADPDLFRVLVADLDGPDEKYGVTESILTQLRNRASTLDSIEIEALEKTITVQEGTERARVVGKVKDADVVFWGWYRTGTSPDSARATLQFEIIGEPEELTIPRRGEALYSTSTPRNFEWKLADEVEHVVLATLGYAHFEQGAYSAAISFYEKALKQGQRPADVPGTLYFPPHFLRGLASQKQDSLTQAIDSYEQAIEINPSHAGV